MIHEVIHADMFRKLDGTNLIGNIEDLDFDEIYRK